MGVIPEDWEVSPLETFTSFISIWLHKPYAHLGERRLHDNCKRY